MDDYYLVEAKQEYTSYLITTLTPSMYTGFKDLFEQSKKIINGNSVFKNFQILLSNVPKWNNYMLEKELSDITKETGCDWLDNLITAVFVSHSKILTSVKVGNYRPKNKKIDLKIPDTTSFIHQCYVQAAREFYKNPMLFLDDSKMIPPNEILKNQNIVHSIIKESIMSTIRKLLPFRNILNEYLALDNGNNTIFIGNTSVGSRTIDNTPSVPAITLPPPTVQKEENTVISNIDKHPLVIQEQVIVPPKKEESVSEEEKEVIVGGKELDLLDLDIDLDEKPLPKSKKDLSLDSMTVQQMVNNIKEEFNVKDINNKDESSLNLDDLSFLDKANKELPQNNPDNLSFNLASQKQVTSNNEIIGKNMPKINRPKQEINLEDLSLKLDDIISKKSEDKRVTNMPKANIVNQRSESIDLEKIKQELLEDGTIANTPIQTKPFPLTNIMPQVKEKSVDKKVETNNQIKKISIKYNIGVPLNTKKSSTTTRRKKTTLLDDANESDSSEMIFK
jgi:hypothetical protein